MRLLEKHKQMLKEIITHVYVMNYRYLLGQEKDESLDLLFCFVFICLPLNLIRNRVMIRRVQLQRKVDKQRR